MKKGRLIGAGIVAVLIILATVTASLYLPGGRDLPPAQGGSPDGNISDNDTKATSAGTIRQVMTLRTDLSGSSLVADRPFFLQLRDSIGPEAKSNVSATEMLTISGIGPKEVEASTYEPGRPLTSWHPIDVPDGSGGLLVRSGKIHFEIDDEATVLIMVIIRAPGTYEVSVSASEAITGASLAPPVKMNVTIEGSVPYLFERPALDEEFSGKWSIYVFNSTSTTFNIGARTTALWKDTESYPARYGWTIAVINPDHMTFDIDLAKYNTGDPTLDPADLVNTSVDSTWSWGVGSPLHVVWDPANGVRLEGSAVTTPTTKELTQGGTRAAWADGTWEPSGSGELTFHQVGHYIFLITLTKDDRAVSEPLILESIVS